MLALCRVSYRLKNGIDKLCRNPGIRIINISRFCMWLHCYTSEFAQSSIDSIPTFTDTKS